jgi:NAD+-dependent secondary alcohol dehydrogenase Adh1
MKAARLYQYDEKMNVRLKYETVPDPTINAADEVVVRVGAAGLCRTDLHIIEGVWRDAMDPHGNLLPYIMGHENAGWVEAIGSGVRSVKVGDAVICHPLRSCGICLSCRHGHDMHCESGIFPGLGTNGGFADYFVTSERALIKLNKNVTPIDVAPMADAGITAYRAAKKAAKVLPPGTWCALLGIGGLGHIALQCLNELCSARVVAIDRNPKAREMAQSMGAAAVHDGGKNMVEEVRELTGGGAHVVIDFVGELGVENLCWKMVRRGGQYIAVGYGGKIEVPTLHMIINEVNLGGSLVGNFTELVELMELNAQGKVKMHSSRYKLSDINAAIDDFKAGRFTGRAVVVP